MSRNIVFIGGAGAPNYGDELIVRGWLNYCQENFSDDNVVFYENIASNALKLHGGSHCLFSDSLVKVAKSYTGIGFWEQVKRGSDFIDIGGIDKYKKYDLEPLINADLIHLHGGGYLNNYDPEKGFYIGLLSSLNDKYNTRIQATGIGFGPVPTPNTDDVETIRKIFSRFHSFELRDVDNFRSLASLFPGINFIYGTDDSYLHPINDLVFFDDSQKRLYLSLLQYNLDKYTESFWDELVSVSKDFDEIYFVESYPWQDSDVFEKLKSKIGQLQLITVQEMLNKRISVGVNDLALCARFHVHYLFARCNISGVYFQDSKYYDIKHQSIVDRGSNLNHCSYKNLDYKKSQTRSYISLQDENLVLQKKKFVDYLFSDF